MNKSRGDLDGADSLAVQEGETVDGQPAADRPAWDHARLKVSPEAARFVPVEFAKQHRILPLEVQNGVIRIATSAPGNQRVIDDLRLLTGLEVQETEAPVAQIVEQIAESYQVTVERMIEDLSPTPGANGEGKNLHDIEVMANEPTVINLVNLIISTALRERASDIHLVPFEDSIQLRYRVDGLLQEKPPPPRQMHAALVSRIKIMADMNIAERFMPQDGHIQIHLRGARVDIRVGTMPTIYGESLVMRLLEKNNKVQTHQELGLDPERSALLAKLVEKPHGLFLATGPTGSGKTTSLYSILQSIYTPELKILTIEDPVEYELPGVAQIPVRPTRNFTFATGLRAILRQDPDVVMVGEIRDSETAEIAIRAALTGHQVFSTLHTNDSTGAVTRLLDMGVEAFLISSALEGVLAQRLVRRICQSCRVESVVTAAIRDQVEGLGHLKLQGAFFRGAGCEECRGTGYRGRVGIFELLPITSELRELILQKRSNAELKSAAQKTMLTMHQDALLKASAGLTTLEEILRVSSGDLLEMNAFRYQAMQETGAAVEGVIEAADRKTALQLLGQRGLFPSNLEQCAANGEARAVAAAPANEARPKGFQFGKSRVGRKEITAFTREMSALLGAGIPIPQALDGLAAEEEKLALKLVVSRISESVRTGASLSSALAEHPRLFTPLYVSMVQVGEEAGVLPKVMNDLADLLEHEDEVRGEVRAAVAYPVIVLSFGIVTVTVLLTVVLPKLFSMLTEMMNDLPLPTLILLRVSGVLHRDWPWLLAGLVGLFFGLRWYMRSAKGLLAWDKFKLHLPVVGSVFRTAALSRFARTLGVLAKSGVSLLPALKIVENTIGNRVLAAQIALVAEETRGGDSLAAPLRKLGIFPRTVVQMIEVGEETGKLDEMLLRVAEIEERHMRGRIKILISMLGPFLIIIVGALVGFMVIALLLPIFKLSQHLQ